jgi:hypothetical protein
MTSAAKKLILLLIDYYEAAHPLSDVCLLCRNLRGKLDNTPEAIFDELRREANETIKPTTKPEPE